MLYLVTGGSGSGKSEYAEKLAVEKHNREYRDGGLYYIATMYPYIRSASKNVVKPDSEIEARIKRHRAMRSGKGFETVECYTDIGSLTFGSRDVILIECMSNLLANEMYLPEGGIKSNRKSRETIGTEDIDVSGRKVEQIITGPILDMACDVGCVVVVTNEVFSDGQTVSYDADTLQYIRLLGMINRRLAYDAEIVTEVVCGIPLEMKIRGEEI